MIKYIADKEHYTELLARCEKMKFFLLCEKKVVLLHRNLTAVKFTAIKQ